MHAIICRHFLLCYSTHGQNASQALLRSHSPLPKSEQLCENSRRQCLLTRNGDSAQRVIFRQLLRVPTVRVARPNPYDDVVYFLKFVSVLISLNFALVKCFIAFLLLPLSIVTADDTVTGAMYCQLRN